MRAYHFAHFMLATCAAVSTLEACGASRGTTAVPFLSSLPSSFGSTAVRQRPLSGTGYRSIYTFKGPPDGANPVASLTTISGALYGTTESGGSHCHKYGLGCGTVFKITPKGSETVLYSFKGGADGSSPQAGLIAVNGVFYGTTWGGGADGVGTVFRITASGEEKVIYSFKKMLKDGNSPYAPLTDINGTLYGTTSAGGEACQCGSIFKIDTLGKETVLYRFLGGVYPSDPVTGVVLLNGKLYGTTVSGGRNAHGAIYSIEPAGYGFTTLYNFNDNHRNYSFGSHIATLEDKLYGTTSNYGSGCKHYGGCGTVFKLLGTRKTALYNFKRGQADGIGPVAAPIGVDGYLYGTTESLGELARRNGV